MKDNTNKYLKGLAACVILLCFLCGFAGYQTSERQRGEAYKDTLITHLQATIHQRDTTIERQRLELGNWHNYEWKVRQIFGVDTTRMQMFKKRR